MKQSYKLFLSILILSLSMPIFAQLDNPSGGKNKGGTTIGTIEAPARTVTKPKSLGFDNTNGFKNAHDEQQNKTRKKQKEESLKYKGIMSEAQYKNSRVGEMYGKQKIKKVDTNEGNFLTLSKSVNLSFKDFGAIDGDIISIFHNGIPLVNGVLLDQHYKSFQINLEKGSNKIEVLALNQGRLGANTAKYKLFDKDGILISSKSWFLATGARAIFHVTKNE